MSNQLSILSICDQRRQQTLYNKPLARINMISPYETTNYTKFDLDMRRKAEILKYQKGSTKGNTLTKKQKWTQIMNGNTQTLSTSANNNNNNTCVIQNKPMPLSASNVPPDKNVSVLYNDETVPLYNFINPISTRAYGFTNTTTNMNSVLESNILPNIICESNISNKIASIVFSENADMNAYTININNIPLALFIQGDLSGTNINLNIMNDTVINSIQLNAYYNDNVVPDRSIYQYAYSPTNLIQSYNLDISANTYLDGSTFKSIQYIGNVSISNILLYTSPGFIYDFKLKVNLSYFTARNTKIPSMHASIIANITPDQISLHSCSIQPVRPISEMTTMNIATIN
jgi:hypothetical protein